MKGIAYGVGVGPGDPELMTLKACRLIRENDVIALPGKEPKETVAYQIAVQAVPELADKELIPVYMPMVMDRQVQRENHRKGAQLIAEYLDQGKNVVYLTLGDETELVSGITSFCAAAARMNIPLTEWDEPMHVMPALHKLDHGLDQDGTYVLMKSGSHMQEVKEILRASGKEVQMVQDCGMPSEQVYRSVDEIPDDAGYFALIVAKNPKETK